MKLSRRIIQAYFFTHTALFHFEPDKNYQVYLKSIKTNWELIWSQNSQTLYFFQSIN